MEYVLVPGDVYIRPANRKSHAQQPSKPPFAISKRFVNTLAAIVRHLLGRPKRLVTDTSLKEQDILQRNGFQLLATCKQAYNEGHYMFYAMNTFHWPPSAIESTNCWYANLQPEHRKMIRTFHVQLDYVDLMYGAMNAVEVLAKHGRGSQPDDYDGNAWGYDAMFKFETRMWVLVTGLYFRDTPQNLW